MADEKKRPTRSRTLKENTAKLTKKNVSMVSKKKSKKCKFVDYSFECKDIKDTKNNTDNIDEENIFYDSKISKRNNVVKILQRFQVDGFYKASVIRQFTEQVYLNRFRYFEVFDRKHTDDIRITALQWHPTNPHVLMIGGKGGTLDMYRLNVCKEPDTCLGIGPGGTVEAIRWNAKHADLQVVTASVDGTICSYSFKANSDFREILVSTPSPMSEWFCAVDIHEDGKSVYGGDNQGFLAEHHLDSKVTTYKNDGRKLHNSKIKHLEFNPKNPNLMVTASLDKTVKFWDIRKLGGRKDVLLCLEQDKAISCATFSRSDGCRLLTTDLHSELRVYKGPAWTAEHKILHPHRNFQHMTNIVASWHPTEDLFVIGRYPDPNVTTDDEDVRSIDLYSATSGRLLHQIMDNVSLITSISQFNATGEILATSSGRNLWLRKSKKLQFPLYN